MLATRLAWPKVLGITCALTSLGMVLSEVDIDWWHYALFNEPRHILSLSFLLTATCLLALSYPLFRGREWARRPVLILGCSLILGFLVIAFLRALEPFYALAGGHHGPAMTGWKLHLYQSSYVIQGVGACVALFTPHLVFLYLLCHRDVKAAFHRDATKRSNHFAGADSEPPCD